MRTTSKQPLHPVALQALENFKAGQSTRREFLRIASLVGVTAVTAGKLAGVAPALANHHDPFAKVASAKPGGTLRCAMQLQKMEDPANFDWTEMSNQARQILEYLTYTNSDNVVFPMLAESWEASPDLRQWTFHLRKGVMWHNGDEFIADDVIFNLNRWIDPKTASSLSSLPTIKALSQNEGENREPIPGAIEKIDSHTVRLNLKLPIVSVAEEFYQYPAAIVHRAFAGNLSEQPNGTGPFTLEELDVSKRCVLRRVTETTDGKKFTHWNGGAYIDRIIYYNFSNENQLTALVDGDVDLIYTLPFEQYQLAETNNNLQLHQTPSSVTGVLRFRTDVKPFDNFKLRQAISKAVDLKQFKKFVFAGTGTVGENFHAAPTQPDYVDLPDLEQDIPAAKRLLAEAGYPDGLELSIAVGNTDGTWEQVLTEVLSQQLKAINIDLKINVLATPKFWEIWDKVGFGITVWTERPLVTMLYALAYRSGVPWNETAFSNKDFDDYLDKASAELNMSKRREWVGKAEKILQDAAIMLQPVWKPTLTATNKRVNNFHLHPTSAHQLEKVWLDS